MLIQSALDCAPDREQGGLIGGIGEQLLSVMGDHSVAWSRLLDLPDDVRSAEVLDEALEGALWIFRGFEIGLQAPVLIGGVV